jgi:hypothetical protein
MINDAEPAAARELRQITHGDGNLIDHERPSPFYLFQTDIGRCFAADDIELRLTHKSRHTVRGKSGNR